MKRIAILTCLKACGVCTGASCLKAWNNKAHGFAQYAGEETELAAFFHCNGCGKEPETDPGMTEKLDRLVKEGVCAVHTGVCTIPREKGGETCPTISKISQLLAQRGIPTIQGTH